MENENINTEVVEPQNESEEVKSDSLSSRKQRKFKRLQKIKTKFFDKPDMKYIGPLSYRTLRILAWICIGLGQFAFLCSIGQKMSINWSPINDTTSFVFTIISSMSVAFFVIPAFGIILRKPSSYKNYLFVYGGAYLLIGTIFCISYGRYVDGLIHAISDNPASLLSTIENIITNRGSINVFSDLFLFTLFNTFIFHTPKKVFKGKKLIIFRLFALIPILLSIASYAIKVAINLGQMTMPIYLFPWLTTKSPFVFMIFVVVSLWIKNREKIFIAMGATKQEYNDFLKTNRNSFSFSTQLSLTIVGFVIIEVLVFLAIMIKYVFIEHLDFEVFLFSIVDAYEIGQTIPLLVCIPFVMLFSYTKTHKNKMIDIFIPVGGIAIIGLMYLEYFREFAIKLVEHAN